MTNKEWIQSMSIEELVQFLHYLGVPCSYCEYIDDCDGSRNSDCMEAWDKWLKGEHNESI